jgi:hypothetical protein
LLNNLRKAGTPLDVSTIRGILLAAITNDEEAQKTVFAPRKDGTVFACSESFTKRFL